MEQAVTESSTAWTIVRLNRLSDNALKGRLEVSREPLAEPRGLHRLDAARLLLNTVEDDDAIGAALNVAGPGA